MAGTNTIYITLNTITGNMEISKDGVNNIELIPREAIASVNPVTLQTKPAPPDDWAWQQPFDTMTVLGITLRGPYSRTMRIELQEVQNQAAWSTGNQAGLNAAVADFNAFI